jgi:DNA invertase Pin-like site-specific DNA recombinase
MPGPDDGGPATRDDVLPAGARHCFACGDANPIGMHLNDIRREGEEVLATLHPRPEFQSYPGVLHGGLSATALEEERVKHGRYILGEVVTTSRGTSPMTAASSTRRAGLYVRLSHVKDNEQATEDATERQEERARGLCLSRGWDVVRVFADTGISAFRAPGQRRAPYRPDFEAAVAALESGEITALVFFKFDRLVRDPADFERLLAICEQTGSVLVSVTEPLDTSTPIGESFARMLVGQARMESQNTSARLQAQRQQVASRGLPIATAWRVFGYRYVPLVRNEDGTVTPQRYEIVPEEADALIEAARRVLAGESLNSIARDFNDRGLVPAPPRRNPEKQAKAFYTRRLRRILVNPSIAGLRTYHGEVVASATWPPILDRQTWERVVAVLNAPERRRGYRPPTHALAGVAVCGALIPGEDGELEEHGATLRSKWSHGKVTLACDKSNPGFQGCGQIAIDHANLERVVLAMIEARDWSQLAGSLRELAASGTADPNVADQLAADEAELRSLAAMKALRRIEEGEWLAMRTALLERIGAARRVLERQTIVPAAALDPETPILDAWPTWSAEQKRTILRAIFNRIIIRPATKRGRGPDPDRVVPDWRV